MSEQKHDGWKSRKAQLTMAALAGEFAASCIMVAFGKMTAAEWSSFQQVIVPLLLGLYAGANVAEKLRR